MKHPTPRPAAFTLVELMIVIGIIVLLLAILIPVVAKVKTASYAASTQSRISGIQAAIERYYQDFHAYPGPLSNMQVSQTNLGAQPVVIIGATPYQLAGISSKQNLAFPTTNAQITMAENLFLGLEGGLTLDNNGTAGFFFDVDAVGKGPRSLNPAGLPKQYQPYLEYKPNEITSKQANPNWWKFVDGSGSANDSEIPEFVDAFPAPMPILYLRARVGATIFNNSPPGNPVITDGTNPARPGQYDLSQIIGYTGTTIGVGKDKGISPNGQHGLITVTVPTAPNVPAVQLSKPNDAYTYFLNQNTANGPNPMVNTPRQKDGYILISAGKDRIYGTDDDICNFGSVAP